MSQLAADWKTLVDSGRERRTDGLFKHLGNLDAGFLRAQQWNIVPRGGAGLELFYDLPTNQGQVMPYNRDTGQYGKLNLVGSDIVIAPQGGTLSLPANCVGTSQIQANAVQQRIGSYFSGNSWNSGGTTNAWIETTVTTGAMSCSGAECRIEWVVYCYSSVAATLQIALGWDGSAVYSMGIATVTAGSLHQTFSGVLYVTPSAGTHRMSVFGNINTGTMYFNGSFYAVLYVTEQKR